jgi:hypothetical protein
VLLGYDSPDDFTGLVVSDDGTLSTFEMENGSAIWFGQGAAPAPESDGSFHIQVDFNTSGMVDVTINGVAASFPACCRPPAG